MKFFKSFKLTVVAGVSALLLGCPEAQQFSAHSTGQGIQGYPVLPGDNRCQLEDGETRALVSTGVVTAPVSLPSDQGKLPLPPLGSPIEWVCDTVIAGECADCNPFAGGGCPYPTEKICRVVQGTPALTLCSCGVRTGGESQVVLPPPAPAPVQGVNGYGSKPYYENLVQ